MNALTEPLIPTRPLVDEGLERVSRSIFVDPEIYALEIKRIFNRSWLFLAHESELPEPGDFVTRPMGNDYVIITRGSDGRIRGFLNSCRHRGVQICREDAGRTTRFVCPYHSWTYDTKGALRSTPYDQHYAHLDKSQYGLTPISCLDTYRGLIFGNWDPRAISLDEHLGDAKWYLDMVFGRTPGGMTVLAPPQRWVIETNWKIAALNFMDSQHGIRVHVGPMSQGLPMGAPSLAELTKIADATPQVTFPQGHGLLFTPYPEDLPDFFGRPPGLGPLYKQTLPPKQLSQFRKWAPTVGTIFPNTSFVEPLLGVALDKPPIVYLTLRNFQPIGADKIEVWSWFLGEAEAPAEWRDEMLRTGLQCHGSGGVFEQDDAEVWALHTRGMGGSIASQNFMDFSAGRSMLPMQGLVGPGTAYSSQLTEQPQFGWLKRWKQIMESALPAEGRQ